MDYVFAYMDSGAVTQETPDQAIMLNSATPAKTQGKARTISPSQAAENCSP